MTALRDTLGRELRDLRISVIDKCNFRCTYCMPLEEYGFKYNFLPSEERLTAPEIERVARLFVKNGVDKLRLTGGEPLLRKDILSIVESLAHIEGVKDLALTTNGILLPKLAPSLKKAGLKRLTVSLDTLDPEQFSKLTARKYSPQSVLDGITAAQAAGIGNVKVNTVIMRGVNEDQVLNLASHFRHTDVVLRFIEYMDVGTLNRWEENKVVTGSELLKTIGREYPLRPIETDREAVAQRYAYEDGAGEIGMITSVSRPFCSTCVRIRLTADGQLVTCLFSSNGVDIKRALRDGTTDNELEQTIFNIWRKRADRYSELRQDLLNSKEIESSSKIEMYTLGG